MKQIAILGSTGSIGTQTLEVIRHQPDLQVCAMTAGKNITLFEQQIREFRPGLVCMQTEEAAKELSERIRDLGIPVVYGESGLIEAATCPQAQTVVTAIVGMIGIRPTIAAIREQKEIALANKETLVCAGHLIMPLVKENHTRLLPVDSEHSAIFQSLQGSAGAQIEKILLTASGGPFRGMTREELKHVTLADALRHPNWSMGRKITVDSATLVNKGLEVMEAKWLFDVTPEQIEVVIHPQSVIHSAVQFEDGAVIAQLGTPDMKLPIQYALTWPNRRRMQEKRLDLFEIASLTFERPDCRTFTGLALALEALQEGGNRPAVFNAANERAVALFLEERISFLQIPELIQSAMDAVPQVQEPDTDEIFEARDAAEEVIGKQVEHWES